MPTCREVTRSIASGELEDAGLLERLRLWLHLVRCGHCRNYADQLRAIGEAAKGLFGPDREEEKRIERLEERILDACLPGEGAGEGPSERRPMA